MAFNTNKGLIRNEPLFPKSMRIGGRKISYNMYSPRDPPSGPPKPAVVMVQGWGHVKEEWGKLPFELAASRSVLIFDNPGLGGSRGGTVDDAEFTLESWGADIIALVDHAISPDCQVAVLGYSMGAFVTQYLSLAYPHRVVAIISIGSQGARDSAVAGDANFFRLASKTLPNEAKAAIKHIEDKESGEKIADREKLLRYWFSEDQIAALSKKQWEDLINQTLRVVRPKAVIQRQLKMFGKVDLMKQLNEVKCPCFIIHGQDDAVIPVSNAELLAGQFVQAAFTRVKLLASAHMCWGICVPNPQLIGDLRPTPEATHETARAIYEFLDEVGQRSASRL